MTTILSWNVNGLRAAVKKGFLEWFRTAAPDILCLQETKSSPEQLAPDVRDIAGYRSYFSSAERKGYSGVALYTRTAPQHIETTWGDQRYGNEGRILIADFGRLLLCNIYFPNGKASKERLAYKMGLYTWWDLKSRARERNVGWRIDYFFVSENLKRDVAAAFILADTTGSDHCPVGIRLKGQIADA